MKLIKAIAWLASLAGVLSCAACRQKHAGVEWDALNQEVLELQRAGQLDRAVTVAQQALAVAEQAVGPEHPDVAVSLNNLAVLYFAQLQFARAEPLYRRALAILARFARATGHQHPNFEVALSNYVHALVELGWTEAEIDAALKSVFEDARGPPL